MATGSFKNRTPHKSLMAWWVTTRYGDIKPTSKKVNGNRIHILVPHGGEYNAVKPLIESINKELHLESIEVFDTRARVLETSRKLTDAKIGRGYDHLRQAMFCLEDKWLRLERIAQILGENKNTAVLELHSLHKDFKDADGFETIGRYRRLFGTRVLIPADQCVNEYYEPIVNNLEFLARYKERTAILVGYFTVLGSRWKNINRDVVNDLIGTMTSSNHRFAIIEIPAKRTPANSLNGVKLRTGFEKEKLKEGSSACELSEKEIQAVLSMFDKRIVWPSYEEQSEVRGPGNWINANR